MANLQERNGWFHLQFRYQGRQYSHALDTQERKEAEAIRGSVDRVLIRIKNRELPPPGAQDDVVAFLLAGGKAVEAPAPVKPPLTAKELRDQYLQAHANGAIETNSLATPITRDEAHDHFQRTLAGSKWQVLKGWHVLRHSFASNLAAKGVDQRVIDEFMGHQTDELRRRYRHLFPNQQRQAICSVFEPRRSRPS